MIPSKMKDLPKVNDKSVTVTGATTTSATTGSSTPNTARKGDNNIANNPLMTPKALALSLSPPRAPPFGTIQRALYHHRVTCHNYQSTKALYDAISYHDDKQLWKTYYSDTTKLDRIPLHNNNNRNHYHVRTCTTTHNNGVPNHSNDESSRRLIHRRRLLIQRQRPIQDEESVTHSSDRNHTNGWNRCYHYFPRPHPYMLSKSNDGITRYLFGLGRFISLKRQNDWRDTGIFRTIVDTFTTITIPPLLLLSSPSSLSKMIIPYVRLSQLCQTIPYGTDHPSSQYIHLYSSSSSPPQQQHQQQRRLIFFVHGGAWGSGQPWMYRLMAAPFVLHPNDDPIVLEPHGRWSIPLWYPPNISSNIVYSVAVIGHRTYPDGSTLQEQVSDIRTAFNVLVTQYSHLYDHSNITIIGHSSGAHIALCMVVDFMKEQLMELQQHVNNVKNKRSGSIPVVQSLPFDSFCGISGPYDILHHFDYESARGVEEISPMKPVNGYSRSALRSNSPLVRLTKDGLMHVDPHVESQLNRMSPNIALIHGIEDDTVPFTATAEASRLMRMWGMNKVQEIYIPYTGHQDTILQCMMGGTTGNALMEWIWNVHQNPQSDTTIPTRTIIQSRL